jgi:hypothetical protein
MLGIYRILSIMQQIRTNKKYTTNMSKKSKRKQQRQSKIKMSKKQIKLIGVYENRNEPTEKNQNDPTELGTIYSTGLYPDHPELVAVNVPKCKVQDIFKTMNFLAKKLKNGVKVLPGQTCTSGNDMVLIIDSVDDPVSFPHRPATTLASLQSLVVNIPADAQILQLRPCAWDMDDIDSWGSTMLANAMDTCGGVPPRAFSNRSRARIRARSGAYESTLDFGSALYKTVFDTPDTCFKKTVGGDMPMVLLCRELPTGRVITIDSVDGQMFRGGVGIAHVNMNNGDHKSSNLLMVYEIEARRMLMEFKE